MSGLHRICCCGAPPSCDDCTGCDFGTSYTVSNINGSVSWEKFDVGTVCQTICLDYEESNKTEISVALTFTQGAWTALTRTATEGGGCCYVAGGVLNVSYSINIIRTARCCAQVPPVTLVKDDTYSGTHATDACLSVIAICDPESGQCVWEHTLRVCGFPIQNIELMDEIDVDDCLAGLAIDEEPLSRYGLRVSGACYTWRSPYLAPNLITVSQMQPLGFICAEAGCSDCDATNGNTTLAAGPFSLVLGAEWIDEPDNCEDYLSMGGFIGSWLDCAEATIKGAQPWFSGEFYFDCCYVNVNGGFAPPNYA